MIGAVAEFPRAVLFDLLTALLDSWTAWNAAAGSEPQGRAWRAEYLRLTYGCGAYVAYEDLVRRAARATGLPESAADTLERLWPELPVWSGAQAALDALAGRTKLGRGHQLLGAARCARGGAAGDALGLRRHRRAGRLLQARPAPLSAGARNPRRRAAGRGLRRRVRLRPDRHRRGRPAHLLAQPGRPRASRRGAAARRRVADARSRSFPGWKEARREPASCRYPDSGRAGRRGAHDAQHRPHAGADECARRKTAAARQDAEMRRGRQAPAGRRRQAPSRCRR